MVAVGPTSLWSLADLTEGSLLRGQPAPHLESSLQAAACLLRLWVLIGCLSAVWSSSNLSPFLSLSVSSCSCFSGSLVSMAPRNLQVRTQVWRLLWSETNCTNLMDQSSISSEVGRGCGYARASGLAAESFKEHPSTEHKLDPHCETNRTRWRTELSPLWSYRKHAAQHLMHLRATA